MSESHKQSFIKFAGVEMPVHLAWKKIEVLNVAADHLERLNAAYPELSSKFTNEILPVVRKRLKDSTSNVAMPQQLDDSYVDFLKEKIQTDAPEDCLDALRSAYNIELSLADLIYHVGEDNYMQAMKREALLYRDNKILPDQTAQLWNDQERPAPGKAYWNEDDVKALLGETD